MIVLLNADTIAFLNTLYNPEDTIAIRTFMDKNLYLDGIVRNNHKQIRCNCCGEYFADTDIYINEKYNTATCKHCRVFMKTCTLQDIDKYVPVLFYKNKMGHGVHIAVNGGHKDVDCSKVYAHFFEIDEGSFEEQMQIINEKCKNHPPTMIVQTRKSYHVYFKIKNGDITRFRDIQKRLAAYMGADTQKINESTCMRLPGFYHRKQEPVMVKLVQHNPDIVYTQEELDAWLPKLPAPQKTYNNNFGPIEITGDFQYDALNLFIGHIRQYIKQETPTKIILRCVLPEHDDMKPSAVLFKDTLHYYCKGCGGSMSLYKLAQTNGWYDIVDAYKIFFKHVRR